MSESNHSKWCDYQNKCQEWLLQCTEIPIKPDVEFTFCPWH